MFTINQKFITKNRPYKQLNPIGIVVHETANPDDSDEMEWGYFANNNVGASAHVFIDKDSITQLIPFNEVAWHAGKTANYSRIGVELCNTTNPQIFTIIYNQAVELFAYLFINVLKVTKVDNVNLMSHAECSNLWKETNHQDPISYFNKYGKTVNGFRADVQSQINKSLIGDVIKMFNDENKIATWAKSSVNKLANLGLVKGDNNGNFTPENPISRQEFSVVIDRLLTLLGK